MAGSPNRVIHEVIPRSHTRVFEGFYKSFNDGDVDTAVRFLAQDFEWRPAFGALIMGHNLYRGHAGFRTYCADVRQVFADYRSDLLALLPADIGAIAMVRASGTARASGVPVASDFAILYVLRDNLLATGQTFNMKQEAREAARRLTRSS